MKQLDVMPLKRIVTEIQDELGKLNQLFQEWEGHRFMVLIWILKRWMQLNKFILKPIENFKKT